MESNLKNGMNHCRWKCVWPLLLMLMLPACNPCMRLSRRCPPVASRTDSVYVFDTLIRERLVIDTFQTIGLLPETVRVMASGTDTVYAETVYACAMAWLNGEGIVLRMRNKDSAAVWVKQIEVLEQRLRESSRVSESVEVKTERYVPWFVRILAWVGGLLIVYHVGKEIIKIVVRYMRV